MQTVITAPDLTNAAAPMLHEYPLAGTPPMMTHVHQVGGAPLIAAKGAVERVLAVCRPTGSDPTVAVEIRRVTQELSTQYRVLGVARGT